MTDGDLDAPGAQSYRQDLNIRLMCKNCRTDPPNIIEETANGDLVSRGRRMDGWGSRAERCVGLWGLRACAWGSSGGYAE